ncbi:MAG: hypothetical protein ACK5PZ_10635 [Pirellula sp.]
MSSDDEYEYEYRPQGGLSTKSSRACSLLAVPRTRSIFRYLPAEEQYRYALSRALYVLNAL